MSESVNSVPELPLNKRTADRGPADRSASATQSDAVALGQFLRRARERRGLTLEQISNATKVPWRHLEAIERGDVTALPGGFYARAEIRAYAEAVQVDQNL